jgi:hypothetical protein
MSFEFATQGIEHFCDPISSALYQRAYPTLKAYHSDLSHDTLRLAEAEVGDRFVWAARESGTQMFQLPRELYGTPDPEHPTFKLWRECGCRDFYLITVTGKRGLYCAGYMVRLDW